MSKAVSDLDRMCPARRADGGTRDGFSEKLVHICDADQAADIDPSIAADGSAQCVTVYPEQESRSVSFL